MTRGAHAISASEAEKRRLSLINTDGSVNWDFYEKVEPFPAEMTRITSIEVKSLKEIPEYSYLIEGKPEGDKLQNRREQPCIVLTCDNGAVMRMRMPYYKKLQMKSRLILFRRTYGCMPEIGLPVRTATICGRQRILIEDVL